MRPGETEANKRERMYQEALTCLNFISHDYVELSHEKVMFQRNDWRNRVKRAKLKIYRIQFDED